MLCALIQNETVQSIQDLSEEEIQDLSAQYEFIFDVSNLAPQPQEGWVFDGKHLSDPIGGTASESRKIAKLYLRRRFTMPERVNLEAVASQLNSTGYTLKAWKADFDSAVYIDLALPDSQAAIQFLETSGLIATGRANEIITTPVSDLEKYKG